MGTSVSRAAQAHIRTIFAALAVFALALTLAPSALFAEESGPAGGHVSEPAGAPISVAVGSAPTASKGSAEGATLNSDLSAGNEGSILASALADSAASMVSADVVLDGDEALIGSFTVDGLTYSVGSDGLTLVSVDFAAASDGFVSIPSTVTYNNATYPVTSIAPYAFYLSGATAVELPASITSVDDRAFRSSDVERVEVAADNPNLASFDGVLYDAELSSLLLIPEGRAGAVLLPETTEVVQASKFSHCSLVDAISVEEGGANFASWDGLLYDASGTTLLRVAAGAVEITIRDGCATIAAGALEGCASLERIHAPATIASISPDVFTSIPTISLPATAIAGSHGSTEVETQTTSQDGANSSVASGLPDQSNASTNFVPQLTAMVALGTVDDDLPEVDSASIGVALVEFADVPLWERAGFSVLDSNAAPGSAAFVQSESYSIGDSDCFLSTYTFVDCAFGHNVYINNVLQSGTTVTAKANSLCYGRNGAGFIIVHRNTDGHPDQTSMRRPVGGAAIDDFMYRSTEVGKYLDGRFYWDAALTSQVEPQTYYRDLDIYLGWGYTSYGVSFLPNGGTGSQAALRDQRVNGTITLPASDKCGIQRRGYMLAGWKAGETTYAPGAEISIKDLAVAAGCKAQLRTDSISLEAQWELADYNISFDTSSEPNDEDYPGEVKPDDAANIDSGSVAIEDPKRPGYVFEGWVIPSADGTEAVDQDLVYQDDDGKWYVDASKLPDYAGDDGRVELTARWTSVISVDVPQSVTFYADTATQGQESREGAVSSAFGQNKVANQSEVDLRVVGLESEAVKTTGATLGADSILKKAAAATPSTSAGKLLSLYPSAKQWTADELQDPEAVSNSKAADAVDFDLDDILLEKSFSADAFTIPAGDTLNMGYRLNLTETGQQLDYDKLSTLEDGQSAAIANVSYCFAADGHVCGSITGTGKDAFYVQQGGSTYGLYDIKGSAECLSRLGDKSPCYPLYKSFLDKGTSFRLNVNGHWLDMQLIGICQDTKSTGGKAGLTFQMKDIYAYNNMASDAAGGEAFESQMNPSDTSNGGWEGAALRERLQTTFMGRLDPALQSVIAPVDKYQQVRTGDEISYLQKTAGQTIWLPSMHEVFGTAFDNYNESEALTTIAGYAPFQYQAYQGNAGSATNAKAVKLYNGSASDWWLRSADQYNEGYFYPVTSAGTRYFKWANTACGVAPAFCL